MSSGDIVNNSGIVMIGSNAPPQSISFSCGSGTISINLQTGTVTLPEDITLDDAAKDFWRAVEMLGAKRCKFEEQ